MRPTRVVSVSAPARIHCGLLSVGKRLPVNFGGCGLMIDQPQTVVRVRQGSGAFRGNPAVEERVRRIVDRCAPVTNINRFQIDVEVSSQAPRHSGFGSGTQTAFSLAQALFELAEMPPLAPQELAALLKRGERSAVGTYGFFRGGFLVDRGLSEGESLSPLDIRCDFPDWPICVVTFPSLCGVHGFEELRAFDAVVQTTGKERNEMERLLNDVIVPAVLQEKYNDFCDAIYEYGARSGEYYRDVQRGTFHSPAVGDVVRWIREEGISGVVQSSWGPTLAVFVDRKERADVFVASLKSKFGDLVQPFVTAANNVGAKLTIQEQSVYA